MSIRAANWASSFIPPRPYHLSLLDSARSLVERGEPGLAVITAQTACEVFMEQVFTELFMSKKIREMEEPVADLLPSFNVAHKKVRKLYDAMSRDDLASAPFWSDLLRLAELRNGVVHGSVRQVSRDDAAQAVSAAHALQSHVVLKVYGIPAGPEAIPDTLVPGTA